MPVKEWPVPTALTRWPYSAASCTMRTSRCSVLGNSMVTGEHCWFPAQFLQKGAEFVAIGAILHLCPARALRARLRHACRQAAIIGMPMKPRTLFEKIWDSHVVREEPGKPA